MVGFVHILFCACADVYSKRFRSPSVTHDGNMPATYPSSNSLGASRIGEAYLLRAWVGRGRTSRQVEEGGGWEHLAKGDCKTPPVACLMARVEELVLTF